MTVTASPKNIEWLFEKLYEAHRELQASGVNDSQFVLLTKSKEERYQVERCFEKYYVRKYGIDMFSHMKYDASSGKVSRFTFPHYRISVILMDVE